MKKAIVTVCSIAPVDYRPGLEVLRYSIRKHNSGLDIDWICVSDDIESFDGYSIHRVNPIDYAGITNPKNRFRKAFYCFEAFSMPYEMVLFVDCDVLCTGDISRLFRQTDLDFQATTDDGIHAPKLYRESFPVLSSGLMVIRPRPGLRDELIELASSHRSSDGGDMGIINEWIYQNDFIKMGILPRIYNTYNRTKKHHPQYWKGLKDIRMIHYCGWKPWQGGGEDEELSMLWHEYQRAMHGGGLKRKKGCG